LVALAFTAAVFVGCATATAPPAPPPVPVAAAPEPPPPDEWNIFPDPITGTVEVYHNGVDMGSITGDEPEEPPIPHKRKSDTESVD
jgi:hypothetical protein